MASHLLTQPNKAECLHVMQAQCIVVQCDVLHRIGQAFIGDPDGRFAPRLMAFLAGVVRNLFVLFLVFLCPFYTVIYLSFGPEVLVRLPSTKPCCSTCYLFTFLLLWATQGMLFNASLIRTSKTLPPESGGRRRFYPLDSRMRIPNALSSEAISASVLIREHLNVLGK